MIPSPTHDVLTCLVQPHSGRLSGRRSWRGGRRRSRGYSPGTYIFLPTPARGRRVWGPRYPPRSERHRHPPHPRWRSLRTGGFRLKRNNGEQLQQCAVTVKIILLPCVENVIRIFYIIDTFLG